MTTTIGSILADVEEFLEPIDWGRGTSNDLKLRVMADLREDIEAQKDVIGTIFNIEKELGRGAEKMLAEALQAKFVEDGRNVLMHAAACGSKHGFVTLVEFIVGKKNSLGQRVLVRQLREVDKVGAPLLFQAASSNSVRCLKAVLNVLKTILGVAGLDEQLRAVDSKGRNVLMYAATSPSISVFNKIETLVSNESKNSSLRGPSDFVARFDAFGRSLLHHAAESDCPEVLDKVVKLAKEKSKFKELSRPDDNGITPSMYVLRENHHLSKVRSVYGGTPIDQGPGLSMARASSEEEYLERKEEDLLRAEQRRLKLDILLDEMPVGERLASLTQPPPVKSADPSKSAIGGEGTIKDGMTALMHAARGGRLAFNLAVVKIDNLLGTSTSLGYSSLTDIRFLDAALGVDEFDEDSTVRDRRRGMLLEEAAAGGSLDVLQQVASEINRKVKRSTDDSASPDRPTLLRVVLESIDGRGKCLLRSAISSGNTRMVKWVAELISHHYRDSKEVWDRLRGHTGEKSSLACAASTPTTAKKNGRDMFDTVLQCLRQAAENMYHDPPRQQEVNPRPTKKVFVNELLRNELVVTREDSKDQGGGKTPISPLGGAVLQSNQHLFRRVYDAYRRCGGRWNRHQILNQLRGETVHARLNRDAYSVASDGNVVANVPAQMWHTLAKAFEAADGGDASWARWRLCFSKTVQALAERGDLAQIRTLVREKFPLHAHIPVLLECIGEHQENIIETVTLVVVHASNPFVVWAGASHDIMKAEMDLPKYKNGLRRLRDRLDALVIELLDQLPRTVRGVGSELYGSHEPSEVGLSRAREDLTQLHERHRVVGLLGLVVVRWMLEPSLASDFLKGAKTYNPSDAPDPLQHALDRGSGGLAFVNSALVLDYLQLKFWSTVPSFTSRNPFHDTIHTSYYCYSCGETSEGSNWLQSSAGELLRFLQGWDRVPGTLEPSSELVGAFPHSTLLPGLQFTLAGIVGNPVTFFAVPVVRFIFELVSYIAMLGLFCASVSIQKSDEVPLYEMIFYVFVLGLFWRELLEFREALPARPQQEDGNMFDDPERRGPRRVFCLPRPKGNVKRRRHRVASAIYRYMFFDNWNILDTFTIVVVAAAFVFRMLALGEGWSADDEETTLEGTASHDSLFLAQLCLSFSAPLLFSRVLFLSQIDDTLGPMTQVIWVMMGHLARFTVFLLVVMASFALAFHSLLFTCDGVEPSLDDEFGTFWRSLLTMFESMLGNFDFDVLLSAEECNRPDWAYYASVWLLVCYMVIVAILLLNLLIAVMATAHSAVDAHAEEEFHLARAKVIVQTSRAVANARLPTPFNLIGAVTGCLADLPHAIWLLCYAVGIFKEYRPTEPLPAIGGSATTTTPPPTTTTGADGDRWKTAAREAKTERGTPECKSSEDETKRQDDGSQASARASHRNSSPWQPPPAAATYDLAPSRTLKVFPLHGTAPEDELSLAESSTTESAAELSPGLLVEESVTIEPFSESYVWLTLQGGRDRLIFTFTIGLVAIVASSALWIVSAPWIAWRILRWLFPAESNEWRGYTWTAGSTIVALLGWLLLTAATFVYCCTCAVACTVLWLWGVCSVLDWIHWRFTHGREGFSMRQRRTVMPGEERNKDWNKAREVAIARNYTHNSGDSKQFNVGPLLKLTTGMDMDQLALRVKLKAEADRLNEYVAPLAGLTRTITPQTLLRSVEVNSNDKRSGRGSAATRTTSSSSEEGRRPKAATRCRFLD